MSKICRFHAWAIDLSIANHLSCVSWKCASEGLLVMSQSALCLLSMKGQLSVPLAIELNGQVP